MMPAAEWHSELVAGLAAERPALGKTQVMGIRRCSTASRS